VLLALRLDVQNSFQRSNIHLKEEFRVIEVSLLEFVNAIEDLVVLEELCEIEINFDLLLLLFFRLILSDLLANCQRPREPFIE
jgi:hypothetical protein